MSFSDEAIPTEEVTPEPKLVTDENSDDGVTDGEIVVEEESDPMGVLKRERDEYLLALQRTQADFENYRKRIQRMQEEQSARAASALVTKLLPVLDTLDLAQAHQSGGAAAASEDAKALTASRSMLLDVLLKEGLERLDEAGVAFDPAVHDAVAHTDADASGSGDGGGGGGAVVDAVLRAGYLWRGQVLRPAMVSVKG